MEKREEARFLSSYLIILIDLTPMPTKIAPMINSKKLKNPADTVCPPNVAWIVVNESTTSINPRIRIIQETMCAIT
jgi:hypothetical protein